MDRDLNWLSQDINPNFMSDTMDDLPENYDVIVVGTGMTESVIAAAISRIGKTVLHLDPNGYYGGNWASFSLQGFENWIKINNKDATVNENLNKNFDGLINENESVVDIKPNLHAWNIQHNEYCVKKIKEEKYDEIENKDKVNPQIAIDEVHLKDPSTGKKEPQNNIHKLSRNFNLDLCPKLLFSNGLFVHLLISSNVARYTEFKSVTRVLTLREKQLEPVPCSRADVFSTKNVSVVQKRILVKILTLFANYTENLNEFQGFEKKTFLDYLKYKKLPENLIHYILYAIAMGDDTTLCLDGVKACKFFLESLGKYGNTPFIFPIYGSGELPQCFCRLCAVFGGIYCLHRSIEGLILKDNICTGIISNKKRLNAKTIILSSNIAPKNYLQNENIECISRGIFITNRSILKSEQESLTLLQIPPTPEISSHSVIVIELGPGTYTCPENYFLVHMTTKMAKEASLDLKHVVKFLFEEEEINRKDLKPEILWSATWNMARGTSLTSDLCAKNVKICSSVDYNHDYDFSIKEAQRIFKELYPDEDFLPRAPDPDEIVLDMKSNKDTVEKTSKEVVKQNLEITDETVEEKLLEKEIKHVSENLEKSDKGIDHFIENLEKANEDTKNMDKNLEEQNCNINE